LAKFLDTSFDDKSLNPSIEIIQDTSLKLRPFPQKLPERSHSFSNSDNHQSSTNEIETSSHTATLEGPSVLTTSLSTTSLTSSASTKNDEKVQNSISNSADIAVNKSPVFVDIINDDNANFHSMISFANSDAKRKDYPNALKSLKYVIENISLLDVNDLHVL
jgi:hypothetical protein